MKKFILAAFLISKAFAQLEASADGHYLSDGETPVLLIGSAPWTINTNLTYNEMKRYTDSCATHNINYWQVMALTCENFSTNGKDNAYGVDPWTDTQDYGGTPSSAYWTHLDSVVGYAKSKGIYVMLYPAYLGASGNGGLSTEVDASSLAEMYSFGQFIGGRYKDSTNVIWGMAGDLVPTSYIAKVDTLADGIRAAGSTQLISTRDQEATTTDTYWGAAYETDWGFFLRGTYPYWTSYEAELIYDDGWDFYNRASPKPATLQEAWYENEHSSTQAQLRQQAYYAILSGLLAGQIFGNCPQWHFSEDPESLCGAGDWTNELNTQGMNNQKYCAALFNSRYWWKLIPDSVNAKMTAGYGTVGQDNYVTTAFADDGSSFIAYLPSQGSGVTIDPSFLDGDSCRVNWFNPATGAVTFESNEDTGNTFQVTPPSSGDWVLVVDSEDFDAIFYVPGGDAPLEGTATYLPIRTQ